MPAVRGQGWVLGPPEPQTELTNHTSALETWHQLVPEVMPLVPVHGADKDKC